MQKIAVIVGSTRKGRISPQIANWVLSLLQASSNCLEFELIDIADFKLPLFDEPHSPKSKKPYQHAHTINWSAEVARFAGFVFVFPEYNGSYPAALKNAVDYLFHEWQGKPASYVSYGFSGGKHAAKAFEQLAPNVGLTLLPGAVNLTLSPDIFAANRSLTDPHTSFASHAQEVSALAAAFENALQN